MGNITDLTTSWEGYTRGDVEDIIKQEFANDKADIATKYGATYFDQSTMTQYGFASSNDKDAWIESGDESLIIGRDKFEFSGKIRQLKITTEQSTTQWFTTTATKAEITVGFISQEKDITATSWSEVFEYAVFSVLVDKGNTGAWTTIVDNQRVQNGNTLTVDVRKHLSNGNNRVRFIAKGETSEESASLIFNVNVTTMYLSPSNFEWAKPFIEGDAEYRLGGVNIGGGALDKTLYVKVTGNGVEEIYEERIGTTSYIVNAYYFKGMVFPSAGTGVYHIDMWLDANGVESEHLHYDIMCVAQSDVTTAQLVVINDAKKNLKNYYDGEVVKYACYNGSSTTASPTVEVKVGDVVIKSETLADVNTNSARSLAAAIEVESDAADLILNVSISNGNTASVALPLDNSVSYPAKRGAAFYFNAATRSNTQENKQSVINEVNGEAIATEWTNIDFVDGVDGWTTDDAGRKCLRIPAGGLANINFKPFASGRNKSIELCYKVANAANYDDDVISIATNSGDSFVGVKVKPTNVAAFSLLKKEATKQSYNLKDGEMVHIVVSLTEDYRTTFGNLAKLYVNGEVRCEFDYADNDSWVQSGNIILGSTSADLYVYKMRVYNEGSEWIDTVQNFVNCQPTIEEKRATYDSVMAIVDDSYNIDYDAVYKAGLNTIVIEMLDGAQLPDSINTTGGKCNTEITINNLRDDELDDDLKRILSGMILKNQPIEGQGTTAMTYFRWNFRWKLSSDYGKRRITAKKNVASSMHSHKMGATRAYNELHRAIVGANEANGRVAVSQYPAFGFLKELTDNGTYAYTFIGLYTVGADKGDAVTFGYDDEAYKDSLISLEGSDHTPLAIGFDYPWSATRYSSANEAMGAILSGSIEKGWEVSEAGGFATDEASDEANIQSLLNAEFKPAYDMVYGCAPFIEGVTASLEEINANISAWQKAHTAKEFYTDGVYDIYYYDRKEGKYKPNGINLLTQFPSANIGGLTLEEKTALFIQLRKEYFKAHISDYFHLEDALFCLAFLLIFGATDNFKKNSYPYKFSRLSDGGKWRWRQDDLDTILDINNQGFAVKAYSILMGDITASESVFKGEDSVFWSLLAEVFAKPDESNPNLPSLQSMVIRILDKMVELCPASYGTNKMERLVGYVRSAFWDYAQNYFPQSAYNEDASWTYEEAWGIYGTKYQNNVHPLQQSLGGHYEAERRWVEMRMIFIASMFGFADFAVGSSEKSLGQINYRVVGTDPVHYNIVPAIDINPTILIGDSRKIEAGERVMAGDVAELVVTGAGDADTTVYIQGADYIRDLGDLRGLKMVANTTLTVASARLQSLKIGDEVAENVTSNVGALNIGSCPSLEHINARNVVSLGGAVSLNGCPRVKEALFAGSSINSLAIPEGSKIESISLPSTIQTLSLVRVNRLKMLDKSLPLSWVNGVALLSGNNTASNSAYRYCNYVNVSRYTSIEVDGYFGSDNGLHFYDSNKAVISFISANTLELASDTQSYNNIISVPENAVYCRLCGRIDADLDIRVKETSLIIESLSNIASLRVENCEGIDEFGLLKDAFSAEGSALRSVRVIGFDHSGDATDFNMLATLASGNYIGIDANGRNDEASLPVIEGTIHITDPVGEEEYNAVVGAFPALTLDATNIVRYIKFADPVVAQICADNWGDGTGITEAQVASVTNISNKFADNTAITTFNEFEKFIGVTSVGLYDWASKGFNGSVNLQSIKLPASAIKLCPNCFTGLSLIETLNLDNIEEIGSSQYRGGVFANSGLRSINMPKLKAVYGNSNFYNCKNLEYVYSLGEITSLDCPNDYTSGQFDNCTALREVVLPETLNILGYNTFINCSELKSCNFPQALTTIKSSAFSGCVNLLYEGNLELNNLTTLGSYAFRGCSLFSPNLKMNSLSSINTRVFNNTKIKSFEGLNVTAFVGNDSSGYNSAFEGCTELTEVSIPNIEVIKTYAFHGCSNLSTILDFQHLTTIENGAFSDSGIKVIRNLGKITSIPGAMEWTLNDGVFANCPNLETVILPQSLASIGGYVFRQDQKLESVIVLATTPPTLGSGVFTGTPIASGTGAIYVPDASVEEYKTATNWSTYADRILPLSQYNG